MHKIFIIILFCLLAIGCDNGESSKSDNEFYITYNANGAEGGTVPTRQTTTKVAGNTGNLVKSGYLFDGWNTSADGKGIDYAVGSSYSGRRITLFAKWIAIYNYDFLVPAASPSLKAMTQHVQINSPIRITGLTSKGKNLSDLEIPDTIDGYVVNSIGNQAFSDCPGIFSIVVPKSVTTIGDGAFRDCSSLLRLILLSSSPPTTTGINLLEGCTATIIVPAAGVNAYKTAEGWNLYSERISGYTPETFYRDPSIYELKTSGIPIVTINTTDGEEITSKTEYKSAIFNVMGDFCGYENLESMEAQVKGRGNSSWEFPQKPYSIKLSSKTKILGMKKSKRWVLLTNYRDRSLLRNYFAQEIASSIYNTVWNPSFKHVHLVINGEYRGVYLLGESIKIDGNRVDIPDISETPLDEGGFICEINKRLDELYNFTTTQEVCISLKDPDDVSAVIQERVKTIIQTAEDILFSDEYCDPGTGYKNYFNVDSIIDWYIIEELFYNRDSANFSSIYFYYNPANELIYMGPIWDFDISCGNDSTYKEYDTLIIKENTWIKRMLTDAAFVESLKERWNNTKNSLYSMISSRIQDDADLLVSAAEFNFEKWTVFKNTYKNEVPYLIQWLKNRFTFLDNAINSL